MPLKGSNQHFTGAASELYVAYKATEGHKSMSFSIFSDCSKSYEYLTNHTFESFSEKVNENYYD